jgi:hypothetical protein
MMLMAETRHNALNMLVLGGDMRTIWVSEGMNEERRAFGAYRV